MSEFFEGLFDLGAERGGWRSGWAIAGAALGLLAGVYLGWMFGGFQDAVIGGCLCMVLGWSAFVILKGVLRFAVVFAAIAIAVLGWYWLTGRIG